MGLGWDINDERTLLVTAEVECGKADIANGELLGRRVKGRLQDGDAVVLEHVQQRRLSSVVEAEKEQLSVLVKEPKRGQHVVEPVHDPHIG